MQDMMQVPTHLIFRQVPHVASGIASPQLAGGDQTSRGDDGARSQNALALDQGALHEDAAVADDALMLDGGRPQQAALADRDIAAHAGGSRQACWRCPAVARQYDCLGAIQ